MAPLAEAAAAEVAAAAALVVGARPVVGARLVVPEDFVPAGWADREGGVDRSSESIQKDVFKA